LSDWKARLALQASRNGERTILHAQHEGPLRLLKTLYPEGDSIAHAVIVHPPGGLVGGDRLNIDLDVQADAHLLATTPAATRFYRCRAGLDAAQTVTARIAAGARLEWLPQETLAYPGCRAHNELRIQMQGQLLASELLVLGLPEADQAFDEGELLQHLQIEGLWLDRGRLRAQDRALLDGPCGLAGHRVLGSLLLAQAEAFDSALAEALLQDARELGAVATLLHGRLLLVRVLAPTLEPAVQLLRAVRARWRQRAWGLAAHEPRVWST
jgi:urease accessory protein